MGMEGDGGNNESPGTHWEASGEFALGAASKKAIQKNASTIPRKAVLSRAQRCDGNRINERRNWLIKQKKMGARSTRVTRKQRKMDK